MGSTLLNTAYFASTLFNTAYLEGNILCKTETSLVKVDDEKRPRNSTNL